MTELQNSLPPGWDCKYDSRSGRHYYINHFTKTTTWEDPRGRHRHLHSTTIHTMNAQAEHIPLQHGSPEFRRNYVYPSQTTPMPAFQIPAHYSPKSIPLQELTNIGKGSPRMTRIQDSSVSTVVDTEQSVAKISSLFPTVSDTHIRLLLKKYMKSIFPQAEETIILDILCSNDNNIQKASDALKEMGFERREIAKILQQAVAKLEPEVTVQEKLPKAATTVVRILSQEEKETVKLKLQKQHKDIPEHLVKIALESVDFDEDRATKILEIMVQEENETNASKLETSQKEQIETDRGLTVSGTVSTSQSRQSLKSLLKTEKSDYSLKDSFSRVIEESTMSDNEYRSPNLCNTTGANRNLVKGANQELLLEDYVKWHGPNPNINEGRKPSLAKGANPLLRLTRSCQACGPNDELRKGPKFGLAKGSIFSQFIGVIVGESRGK